MAYGTESGSFGGIVEHLTALTEKKILLLRRLAVAGGGAALIVTLFVLALLIPGLFLPILLVLALAAFLIWYLWRFTQVEYEYVIADGDMIFSVVYGKRTRRDVFRFSVKDAERILPYGEEKAACDAFPADETRFYAASYGDEDTYCVLMTGDNGRRIRLYFQATPAALTALRRANPSAVKLKQKEAVAAMEDAVVEYLKQQGHADEPDEEDGEPEDVTALAIESETAPETEPEEEIGSEAAPETESADKTEPEAETEDAPPELTV